MQDSRGDFNRTRERNSPKSGTGRPGAVRHEPPYLVNPIALDACTGITPQMRCFLNHEKRDPLSGEVGKTIGFAVSRKRATKLVAVLNEEAPRRWPAEYGAGSAFAVQVTSEIPGAQQMTIDFANNCLNGKSRWKAERDYDTSRTRVCVTAGMMTTGYDCAVLLCAATEIQRHKFLGMKTHVCA